ncbi:MAG: AAA family ATPase [Candidatus Promineifilaceae bacterium]
MKLERLTLNNFRQYFGRQRIEFSKDEKRHVTLIHGVNGAGKTSMFLALNWCLYGKDVISNIGDLISKEAMHQTKLGQLVQTSVELVFNHNGYRYLMRRTQGAVRQVDGTIEPYPHEEVIMKRIMATGEAQDERSPLTIINAILPANVRTYFFFDGEKIDNFARPEAAGEVKDAIYLVLRLEVLDRARKHLKDLVSKYRKELVQTSNDEKLTQLELRVKEEELTQKLAEKQLAEKQAEIESARRKTEEINEQLRGKENVSQLQIEREQIEANLKTERLELEEVIGKVQTKATTAYQIIAKPIVTQALSILDEKREKGQIPSNIRQQFVQDLLEKLICICGRPITEHSSEYAKLQEFLLQTVPASLENDVLDTNNILRVFQANGANKLNELNELMQSRVATRDRIRALEARLSDLHIQLKDSPLESVAKLEKNRQEYQADIESNLVLVGSLKERIQKTAKQIEKLTEDIKQAQKSSAKARHLQRKMELAQSGAKAIDETYQTFADTMRQQIESKTHDIFRSLIWKDSHFTNVKLGADYNLEVIDRYGKSARPELSAGERQVLSLSFITAMSQVSQEEASTRYGYSL